MSRKVAIVGYGGVFPACSSLSEFEKKLFNNESLVRTFPDILPYAKQFGSKVSGYVSAEDCGLIPKKYEYLENYIQTYEDVHNRIPLENLETACRGSIWGMLATQDCIAMSGWDSSLVESERTGVTLSSGGGPSTLLRMFYDTVFKQGKKTRHCTSHNVDRTMNYREAANISCLIKNKGITESISSACTTGLGNIGYAYRLIKDGYQDRMLAGGTEDLVLETFAKFDAMRVLSKKYEPELSSRPFDKGRDGFVASSGCAMFALEDLSLAVARGASILGVIEGYHNNSDGDGDMFNPSYDGQTRLYTGLREDCFQNGYTWTTPDVVKAHGTSTKAGDIVELTSIIDFYGTEDYLISAPKSQFGHMLGAAGAMEFLVSLLMLKNQKVTPCLNSFNLSEDLESPQKKEGWVGSKVPSAELRHLIPQESVEKEVNSIVASNYGFGGTNASIRIAKHEE